mgnify:CR=1 FL=1
MAGELLFTGIVWGSIAAVLGAFGYVTWQLVTVRQ